MGSRDTLASFFVRLLVLPLGLLSLYAGHKSYLAINNLHSDKNRAEKAAEYSDKAWRELWHTRLTQTSGVATVCVPNLNSIFRSSTYLCLSSSTVSKGTPSELSVL